MDVLARRASGVSLRGVLISILAVRALYAEAVVETGVIGVVINGIINRTDIANLTRGVVDADKNLDVFRAATRDGYPVVR
jgi:hypothetical protein